MQFITVEPLLSGYPRGTGKWLLDGGWPLHRGLSEMRIILAETSLYFKPNAQWEEHYWPQLFQRLVMPYTR